MREIVLNDVGIKRALKIMMAETDVNSFADLARLIDIKETTFRSALTKSSIRVEDFKRVAESLGYSLILRFEKGEKNES